VLLGHGTQTKIPGTTLQKEMFLIVFWRKPGKCIFSPWTRLVLDASEHTCRYHTTSIHSNQVHVTT